MPIQSGDIKLLASKIMDDVPNGGGGPTGNAIADGASNAIFSDVTERQRAVGGVSIRQLFGAVQTPTTDAYMDATVVLSQVPNDPNVSITLAKTGMFAKRTEIANAIENYLIAASEWAGFLFENHVAGQRSIQLFQRPGTPPPAIGRTLVLVQNEGLPNQVLQYVRVTRMAVVTRTFTEVGGSSGSGYTDYQAEIVTCDISDVLRASFGGSPPSRLFTKATGKTLLRDTTVADAATFYGASPLSAAGGIGDSLLRVASIYTQLVPSARTESAALDQKPASQRTLTLAETPRLIEVGVTPHTMRLRVGQENRGFSWVQMLKPRPAPGTIVISYMALGNWYTVSDDGAGGFTGAGVGQVIYPTGSLSITLPSMPDAGTSIIFQWGESTAFTNRAGQGGFRAPEFAWALPQQGIKPGSVVVKWLSNNVLKTATDNGSGGFTGDASGEIDYATGKIYLRPAAMIDAGGEFQAAYEYSSTRTETFNAPVVDAGGFGTLPLSEAPTPKSVTVRWITVRNVLASSGTSEIVSKSGTTAVAPPVTVVVGPTTQPGNRVTPSTSYTMPGTQITFKVETVAPQTMGTYTWEVDAFMPWGAEVDPSRVFGTTTGTFSVTPKQVWNGVLVSGGGGNVGDGGVSGGFQMIDDPLGAGVGEFTLTVAADCLDLLFAVSIKNQALTGIARSSQVQVDAVGDRPAVPWVAPPPPPVIVARDPDTGDPVAQPLMEEGGVRESRSADVYVRVVRTKLDDGSIYADKDGMGYDLPEVRNTLVIWSLSDLATGFKTITSVAGVPTVYHLWK